MTLDPIKFCTTCNRQRDCLLHMRAEFPPAAAEKWLRRTCPDPVLNCEIGYHAGFAVGGRQEGTQP